MAHIRRAFTMASGKKASSFPLSIGAGTSGNRAPASLDSHRPRIGAAQLRWSQGHARACAAIGQWAPQAERKDEIPFVVSRVVLQDFTGVPLLADLAAMRSAAQRLGKNPKKIEPLVPVDLVATTPSWWITTAARRRST
jgi:hypothetical protein